MDYGIKFAHYGEDRDVNPTVDEFDLFGQILVIIGESGRDVDKIRLVRRSDKYLTACVYETDICRFKLTDRTKWIELPYSDQGRLKVKITHQQDIHQYAEELIKHYDLAVKWHEEA